MNDATIKVGSARSEPDLNGLPELLGGGGVLTVGGPDGVGKTTLCDAILRDVLTNVEVLHVRFPGRLPRRDPVERRELRLGKGNLPDLESLRVYAPTYGRLLSVAKTLYLFVDFVLGWITRVRPLVKKGGWVLFERGWWDHAVDPRRYRIRPPARLVPILGRLLPRSDLVLVLEAEPEVIVVRKPQLPPEELARQMDRWRRVLPSSQKRVYLDASLPAEEIVRAVYRELTSVLADRKQGPSTARR